MMKKILFISITVLLTLPAFAQQESQFTNFMHNFLQLNPAYSGVREVPSFTLLHRNQWIGFDGAPVSQVLSFNSPFFNKRVGFGFTLFHRTAGITSNWSGTMAYSYDLRITKDFSMRLGLQGSFRYLGIDFADPDVILRDANDPSTANGNDKSRYTGNFGVGMFASYKQLFFGVSAPHLFPNEIGFNASNLITAEEKPHIYAMAGFTFPVSDKISLRPTVLTKYVKNAPFDADVNMSVLFGKEVTVGVSYRVGGSGFGESADLLLFYQLNTKLGAGLAYDFSLGDLSKQNSGSFEAIIRYDIRSDREDLTNPRFF